MAPRGSPWPPRREGIEQRQGDAQTQRGRGVTLHLRRVAVGINPWGNQLLWLVYRVNDGLPNN